MPPTRAIIHTIVACVLVIAAAVPGGPTLVPAAPPAATDTAGDCDRELPYPAPAADPAGLTVKPPCHADGTSVLDGVLSTGWTAPAVSRLAHLRPRAHLPDDHLGGVDTRPA
ncbi:hypothetical protein ACGFIG_09160 [Micromonospora sp. NPDC049048]|uniref:hypothetical protein n=1 Tax=Micromonospora sp. NPDC049048 TaxID=3364263 RepID=UPI00372231F8